MFVKIISLIFLYFLNIKNNLYFLNKNYFFNRESNLNLNLISYKNYLLFSKIYINNIAKYYFDIKDYDKSIYYYCLMIKLDCKEKNTYLYLMKIGNIFLLKKEYKKSKFIYEQAYILNDNNYISKKLLKIINKLEKKVK